MTTVVMTTVVMMTVVMETTVSLTVVGEIVVRGKGCRRKGEKGNRCTVLGIRFGKQQPPVGGQEDSCRSEDTPSLDGWTEVRRGMWPIHSLTRSHIHHTFLYSQFTYPWDLTFSHND
ncbi:hypothetical protein F5884DRAFT_774820 [Xylogone sp. PMI_703]|nr:hypothetical protein F5884DRAFT_774820 [Xylogone sp. PMI_703]